MLMSSTPNADTRHSLLSTSLPNLYNVFCFNVNGLSRHKLNNMREWLTEHMPNNNNTTANTTDTPTAHNQTPPTETRENFLFGIIIEHHFISDSINDNWLVVSSMLPEYRRRATGHQNGGLGIIMNPTLWARLGTILYIEEHFIQFSIGGISYTAVYLPPSLSDSAVSAILQKIQQRRPTTFILGDFNVDLRPGRGTTTRTEQKLISISRFMARSGYSVVNSSYLSSATDFLLMNDECDDVTVKHTLKPVDENVVFSDHFRMDIHIRTHHSIHQQGIGKPRLRFNFKRLNDKRVAALVRSAWNRRNWKASRELIEAYYQAIRLRIKGFLEMSEADIICIVDEVYSLLLEDIYHTLDMYLGTYDPEEVKKLPDNYTTNLERNDKAPSTTDAIRHFKRSLRGAAKQNPIVSSDANVPILDAAISKMRELFTDTDTPPPSNPHLLFPFTEGNRPALIIISPDEVKKTICRYPSAKSGGLDGLDARFWKCFSRHAGFIEMIAKLFSIFATLGKTPSGWNESLMHLIPKDPAVPTIDHTRPISLTPIIRRIFEKVVMNRWTLDCPEFDVNLNTTQIAQANALELERYTAAVTLNMKHPSVPPDDLRCYMRNWRQLSECQGGFRTQRNTLTQALLSDTLAREGYKQHIFIDFKAAYDLVNPQAFISKLCERRPPQWALRLIISLMTERRRTLITLNRMVTTEWILQTRGLPQGSVLSPFCFNMFLDDLPRCIDRSINQFIINNPLPLGHNGNVNTDKKPVITVMFADDVKLCLLSEALVRPTIDALERYAARNRMVIGVNKCALFNCRETYYINGSVIPTPPTYKYLGFPHTGEGIDFNIFIDNMVVKTGNMLKLVQYRSGHLHPKLKLDLFKIFVNSVYQYGLPLAYLWSCLQPGVNFATDIGRFNQHRHKWTAMCGTFNTLAGRFKDLKATMANQMDAKTAEWAACERNQLLYTSLPDNFAKHCAKQMSGSRSMAIHKLSLVQNDALKWVCGTHNNHSAIRNYITGTPTVALQGQRTLNNFIAKLKILPKSHPLWDTLSCKSRYQTPMFVNDGSINKLTAILFKMLDIDDYEPRQVKTLTGQMRDAETFMSRLRTQRDLRRDLKLDALFDPNQVLIRACQDSSKSASGIDKIFHIPSSLHARLAVKWRVNAVFVNKTCELHGVRVSRHHLRTCGMISDQDGDVEFDESPPLYDISTTPHYCLLDALLNRPTADNIIKFSLLIGKIHRIINCDDGELNLTLLGISPDNYIVTRPSPG